MRGGSEYAAHIKCAGRGGAGRGVRALCGTGRPALSPLVLIHPAFGQLSRIFPSKY